MFFGGGFRPRRAQQPRPRQQAHAEQRGGMSQFVQFLPLLFIFLLSLLSIPSSPDVPFRWVAVWSCTWCLECLADW